MEAATGAMTIMVGLLWVVAAAIIGLVLYLSTLEREGDFAVFKATGVSTSDMVVSLAVQAVVLALLSSVLAIGFAYLITPFFPVELSLPVSSVAIVPIVAVAVGIAASIAGLRRVITVDPALAFE